MGCLPIIVLFIAGFGVGFLVDGRAGAIWGAGIGLAVGIIAGVGLGLYLHRKHRRRPR
ncbi:hypothetical protein [Oleiagrimonas sp. C23AA]|uniref:hypothetical protein n=1 Tax=Oleiagrimonas sp. C23AA TaxID=2719047 RepID=UPI00141EC2D0|nr:hypothetical protein [Oleiagrimonas sp. C23AA]NII10790.1 hypothetical protein [Oleiagrimonas sp. C23AA]